MVDTVQRSPINLGRMGPIAVIPPGFMGLLQLKQLGQLPGVLSSVVAPVIEMRDWYMTGRRVGTLALFGVEPTINGGILSGPVGFKAFTIPVAGTPLAQVPAGQIWYVEHMAVFGAGGAAADSIRIAPFVFNAAQSEWYQVGPDYTDVVTARVRNYTVKNDRPFWAFPGDVFGVLPTDSSTATSITCGLQVRATPMTI